MSGLSPDNRQRLIDWQIGKRSRPVSHAINHPATMFDKMPNTYQLPGNVIEAIRGHLQTRAYPADHDHQRSTIIRILRDKVKSLPIAVYAAWKSDANDGRQLYRTAQSRRGNSKDASWALVRYIVTALLRR